MDPNYGLTKDFVFKDAVRFLKKKKVLTKEEYMRIGKESRHRAFTVSDINSLEVLQAFLNCLTDSARDGLTLEQFRERIAVVSTFLENKEYVALTPDRINNIFLTNMQSAFNAGHYKNMSDPVAKKLRPYWKYVTAGDGEVRESHQAMEGRVFPADHPIWDTWYPPNGFRCRCLVVSLTKGQVEKQGLEVENEEPCRVDFSTGEIIPLAPDKGFKSNPGKDTWEPDLDGFDTKLKQIYKGRAREMK